MPSRPSAAPIRPLQVLIEDPRVDLSEDVRVWPFDVTVCAGPESDTEECPLVMDGSCPLGRFDVVVGAVRGPWAASVRAAWAETGTAYADGSGTTAGDSADLVACHIGAALQALYARALRAGTRRDVLEREPAHVVIHPPSTIHR
jgi:hypothetical protein